MISSILLRTGVVAVTSAAFAAASPPLIGPLYAALAGAAAGAVFVLAEARLTRVPLNRLIGATIGLLLGSIAGALVVAGLNIGADPSFLNLGSLVCLIGSSYLGVSIGASKGALLNLQQTKLFQTDDESAELCKVLDTSAIIDGRIADLLKTGFLDGTLIVPQFVLSELDLVADSSDAARRNRGRRGLSFLQQLQEDETIDLQIAPSDHSSRENLNLRLVGLAKESGAKIVTVDHSLNKLAKLHGVRSLNLNELANAMKPAVVPGETMSVLIIKPGKELHQGVAYLDDGTMVVVDNARSQLSNTIEVTVTSALQTSAGRMIFGRYDEVGADGRPTASALQPRAPSEAAAPDKD